MMRMILKGPTQAEETRATVGPRAVRFAKDAEGKDDFEDVMVFHDGPTTEEEASLVYDLRSESRVSKETTEQVRQARFPGAVGFQQSVDTLYRKKGYSSLSHQPTHRRASVFCSSNQTTKTDIDKSLDDTEKQMMLRVPRHFKWAVRTICESDLRGLEHVYNAPAIQAHRKECIRAVLTAQAAKIKGLHNYENDDCVHALTQHSAYVAFLIGQGDRRQVIEPPSHQEAPRAIRNPAA